MNAEIPNIQLGEGARDARGSKNEGFIYTAAGTGLGRTRKKL